MSKIEVDAITEQSGTTLTTGGGAGKTVVVDATTVTLGRCGGTVALASGASQTGFGRTGTVDWQTTPKTGTFTAANGEGYFVNTSGGVSTANLPAGSAGAIVSFADYTRTFATNNLTISPNGSEKIGGVADDLVLNTNGQALTLIYVDGTEGWINVQNAEDTETGLTPSFIAASGGNSTATVGDFKIHTFTGPGTFTVSCAGNSAGSNTVSYMVVAGAGGGGTAGGGGGAGGYREGLGLNDSYAGSPLRASTGVPVTATGFPIVVGGGGATSAPSNVTGNKGSNSSFSIITSAGGGAGRGHSAGPLSCVPGGSGGGGGSSGPSGAFPAGVGNTPPTSPPQGNPGGPGTVPSVSGGGGGAGGAGVCQAGGAATVSEINNSPVNRAGGGGGGPNGAGGSGAGDGAGNPTTATAGTANTGSGGGGGWPGNGNALGGGGGSGIVIIRYKFQ